MLTGFSSYDASLVKLIIGGYVVQGFAPDSKITVAMEGDITTSASGTDGDVATALMRDVRGTMTVSLFEASPANQILAAFVQQSRISRVTNFPIFMSDPAGSYLSTLGWIQNQGDSEKTTENPVITWTFGLKNALLQFNSFDSAIFADAAGIILPTAGAVLANL